jgi:hypothetical protein
VQDPQSSPWTELGRQHRPGSEYDVTNASAALNNLTEWVGNHGNTLPPYDHLQLFSGYDLTNDDGNTVTTGTCTGTVKSRGGVTRIESKKGSNSHYKKTQTTNELLTFLLSVSFKSHNLVALHFIADNNGVAYLLIFASFKSHSLVA